MSVSGPTAQASERGFSLLELMITMSLLGIFLVAVHESVIVGLRAVDAGDDREGVRQQLTNVLERFIREASMARVVDQAQDEWFQFDADFDGDDDSSEDTELNVQYRVRSEVLQRQSNAESWVTLVPDLTSWDFDYVRADGTAYTGGGDRDEIRLVQVTVTATQDDEAISLTNAAYLHNMVADN